MATRGLVMPLTANVDVTVENKIYEKLSNNPIPIFSPIPPFTFREESDMPIEVRINAAAAIA